MEVCVSEGFPSSPWRAYKNKYECLIKNRIKKAAAKKAARKGAKQGVKSIPVAGWLVAGGCFCMDLCDPKTSLAAAIQSNIPYYGIGYEIYTICSDPCDEEAVSEEIMREMSTGLGYEDLLREFGGTEENTPPAPQHPVP